MKTALILTTYNRPDYLRQCLESVSRASKPDVLILVDDASTDKETIALVRSFTLDITTHIVLKSDNKGIKDSLKIGFDLAFGHYGCDVALNLDGDAIVKPDFIERLTALYDGKHIVSGFNSNNPKNPILKDCTDHVLRQHGNGINMLLNKQQYETIVLPALQSKGNWDFNSTNKQPFKITKPSVVQHIGIESSMGHVGADVACDFKLLHLPQVTLLGVDSYNPEGLLKSAEISTRDIEFGAVKMLTEKLFSGREAYSNFCINEMYKYVDTTHVLIIHPDSWVLNASAWDDSWLRFDYIGAKWWYQDGMNNGNGGFSLRSKKLLDLLPKLKIATPHPEDHRICRDFRKQLEAKGIKFAPDDVCDQFSIECWGGNKKYNGSFGYHGQNIDFILLPKEQRPYELFEVTKKRTYPALENYRNRAIGRHNRRY